MAEPNEVMPDLEEEEDFYFAEEEEFTAEEEEDFIIYDGISPIYDENSYKFENLTIF